MIDAKILEGFAHRFVPGSRDRPVLLLLHGTGGDENDLVPLGPLLAPGAAILSPRGRVLEHGMPRFFRRIAEGVFDVEDLIARTHELAEFVIAAAKLYRFRTESIVAVGFSNGANVAASLLLLHPGLIRTAVLLRPMVPFSPERLPDLSSTSVFIGSGRSDPIARPEEAERLARLLENAGARVELHWANAAHALIPEEIGGIRSWIERISTTAMESGAT